MQQLKPKQTPSFPKKLLMILLLVSVIIYLFTPLKGEVSMSIFYTCFSLMLLSNFIYFKAKKKENYLDFDTIFIVVYCLVGFSTTFFYHDKIVFNDIFLGFPVDDEYINKSNILFLIGLQSYMWGNLTRIRITKNKRKAIVASTNFLVALIFILIIAFFAVGGLSYYRAEYNNKVSFEGVGMVKHVLLLLVATAMALIGTEFYNKKISPKYKISKVVLSALILLVITLLWAGNRTAATQILLPIVCLYALFFKNIKFKSFVLLAVSGIILMWFVQRMRTNEKSLELTNPIMLILDLTIPVRNTYTALQYVDRNGFTYGSSMVLDVSGVVPFMPSFIKNIFPDINSGSAEVLTEYTFKVINTPEEYQIGLGTTIIADVYLAFGLVGAIILMYLLGYLVNRWTVGTLYLDYYSIIMLSAMLGNAIFVVRAGYMHPARFIVWALLLASFNRFIYRAWKK